MSWATGHHSSAYFVFVKAENENMLGTIGHRLLSTYFSEAPPSAFSYFYGPKWDKMHLRVGRGELAESVVADALRDPATPRPEVSSRAFRAPAHGLWLERVDFDGSALR